MKIVLIFKCKILISFNIKPKLLGFEEDSLFNSLMHNGIQDATCHFRNPRRNQQSL